MTGRTRHQLLTLAADTGPDGVPRVAGHPWHTAEAGALVREHGGADGAVAAFYYSRVAVTADPTARQQIEERRPGVKVLQVNVGRPRTIRWHGHDVSTAIVKAPVEGRLPLRFTNLDGDGQADRTVHGGWEKAVYAYPAEFYDRWRREDPTRDFPHARFGENLTTEGFPDGDACVGDRVRIGTAELVVTEPRLPCFKLGIAMRDDSFVQAFLERGLLGFYLAVVREGDVAAGDEIVPVHRHPARMPVTDITRLYAHDTDDVEGLRRAASLDAVPESWRQYFDSHLRRLERRRGRRLRLEPPAPAWDGYRPLRVRERVQEAPGVVSVVFEDPAGAPLPDFRPGQHLTLRVPVAEDAEEVRSYSLSDRPGRDSYRVTVKRAHADARVSGWVHDRLAAGAMLSVRAPAGGFSLDLAEVQRPVVLVGAGIGITPLLGMVEAIAHRADQDGRPRETWLFHGIRDNADAWTAPRLRELSEGRPWLHAEVRRSAEGEGRVDAALLRERLPHSSYDYYLCGPPTFMTDLHAGLAAWGVPDYRVHVEAFGPASLAARVDTSLLPVASAPVRFSRSGVTAKWTRHEAPTLLELAEDAGVSVPFGCRAGSCGTCATRLSEGSVAYLVDPAAPLRDGEALPCVAYPAGPLTLDT